MVEKGVYSRMNQRLKMWGIVLGVCAAWSMPVSGQVGEVPDSLRADSLIAPPAPAPAEPIPDSLTAQASPAATDTTRMDSLAAPVATSDTVAVDTMLAAPADTSAVDTLLAAPATDSLHQDSTAAAAQTPSDSADLRPVLPALPALPAVAGARDSLSTPKGTSGGDRLGSCLAVIADADSDGRPDIATGAPGADSGAVNAGAVLILGGRHGDTIQVIPGERAGDALGAAVVSLEDVNGDGTPDLAAGAPFHDRDSLHTDLGKVYVYSGATREVLWSITGESEQAQLGSVLAGLGDTDGDGVPDLAVGCAPATTDSAAAPGASVWIVSGKDGHVLRRLAGEQKGDRFGTALSTAGDVDSDGADDLLVGACRWSDGSRLSTGAAYVMSGRTGSILRKSVGRVLFEHFGYAVAGGRDLNGDGTPDLAVGARFLDQEGGRRGGVYLISGKDGTLLTTLLGQKPGQQFGTDVAFASDLDSDGRADVLVGAPGATTGEASEAVYRLSSGSGTLIFTALGTQSGSRFGSAVAELGDVDGDGRPELVAGAPYHSHGGLFAGAVLAVSGGSGEVVWSRFGHSSMRQSDSERVAPLMSLDQLKQDVAAYSFPVYDSSEVDATPVIRRSTGAVYPPTALGTGATGWVKVKVLVMADGTAAEAKVVDLAGLSPEFGDASLAAVRDWSFLPASRGGAEVACWAVFPIGFSPPLSPEEQRRVDSLVAADSVSRLVLDTTSAQMPGALADSAAPGVMFYEASQVDVPPVLTARVEPEYPAPALLSGEECTVHLRVLVNGQGTVADVEVGDASVRGKGFESAAVTAVGKWRYEAGIKDGRKVPVWVAEEVRFTPPVDQN